MTLSPSGSMQLVIQIDEKNLGLLALGQTAIASADAFPNAQFSAELVYINPGVDAQTGAVEVKLGVPNPPEFLRQNMTISVEIAVARRINAVVIPSSAIMNPPGIYLSEIDAATQQRPQLSHHYHALGGQGLRADSGKKAQGIRRAGHTHQ
jgi:multidrug efflux pump subunit AcrA (membrane-fusion protein)